MRYFDFETVAKKAAISREKLDKLCRLIREEFPRDEMMFELHVLRACLAVLEGRVNIDQAIQVQAAAA